MSNLLSIDTYYTVISILLLLFPIVDWIVVSIFFRAIRQTGIHNNIALTERGRVAAVLAIASTLNALIATDILFHLRIYGDVLLLALSVSLILVGIPNLYWLSLYLRNKFRK